MTARGYVIRHTELGIFVGCRPDVGLAFFNLLSAQGQTMAPCFPSRVEAQVFALGCWPPELSSLEHDKLVYHEVDCDWSGKYATVNSLRAGGLGDYLGEMCWPKPNTEQVGRA